MTGSAAVPLTWPPRLTRNRQARYGGVVTGAGSATWWHRACCVRARAGGGGYAYASISTTSSSNVPSTGTSQSPAPVASAGTERPAIVAVTTGGEVVVLNSKTGLATSTLTGSQDVVGDEIAVTRSAVYFAVRPANSCADEIERVSLAGGTPAVVATGVLPSISPDGTELAYVKEQLDAPASLGCTGGGPIQVVVRDLTTDAQTVYAPPPGEGALVAPVSHLSWSPDGKTLLVSAGPVQDNEGWTLAGLTSPRRGTTCRRTRRPRASGMCSQVPGSRRGPISRKACTCQAATCS